MKILLLVGKLTGGGAERVASLWANGFVQQGHEVGVVLTLDDEPITYRIPDSVRIYSIDCRLGKNRYINYISKKLFQIRKFKNVLNSSQPDVVIAVMSGWCDLLLKVKGSLGYRTIITDHNSFERPESAPMTDLLYYQKYTQYPKFDMVTVLTEADKAYIGDRIPNVRVLPNPLTYTPVENIPPKEKIILATGRIDAWHYKGFDILLESWGMIAHKYPDWKMQIAGVGDKQSTDYLKSIVTKAGVENQVEFLGFCDNMLDVYQKASIFCLSSRYEAFGMVLTEAMSQGCACVSTDYKGRQKEIIPDEKYGLLCDPENHDSLTNALNRMLADDCYRTYVQANAPIRASYYKLDNIMDRWESILNEYKY